MVIDDDQLWRVKVEQFNKKLNQVEKYKSQNVKYQIDKLRENERKRVEALQKYHQIEKAKQKKLDQEHKNFIDKMKKKEELRQLKEKETYEKLKRQESQFKNKRKQLLRNQIEAEHLHEQYVNKALSSIDDKLNQSFHIKQRNIESKSEKARQKNLNASFRNENYKKHLEEEEENMLKTQEKKFKKESKRIEKMYKSWNNLQETMKKTHE